MDRLSRAYSLETMGPIAALITVAKSVGSGSGLCATGQGAGGVASVSDGLCEGCLDFRPLRARDTMVVHLATRGGFLRSVRSGSSLRVRPICAAASISIALEDSATAPRMHCSRSLARSLIWCSFHWSSASAMASGA
jgi:hypothetical protein